MNVIASRTASASSSGSLAARGGRWIAPTRVNSVVATVVAFDGERHVAAGPLAAPLLHLRVRQLMDVERRLAGELLQENEVS